MPHVFVYGTLLFPEILYGLTGCAFPEARATLNDFKRFQVKFGDYPAIIASEDSRVNGKLIFNVDARSLKMLRFYEGDDYDCIETVVDLKSEKSKALVFVWNRNHDLLAESDWHIENFKNKFLIDYTRKVVPETVAEFIKLFP
mgnify:FL=1